MNAAIKLFSSSALVMQFSELNNIMPTASSFNETFSSLFTSGERDEKPYVWFSWYRSPWLELRTDNVEAPQKSIKGILMQHSFDSSGPVESWIGL